jgi:hypothetical protein
MCLLKTFALQCDSEPRRIRWDVIDLVTVMAGAVWYERDREYRETFDTREQTSSTTSKSNWPKGNHRQVYASAAGKLSAPLLRSG